MTPTEAARLLDLPPDATSEQLETRFLDLRRKLEDKIAKAPTPGLQAKYRASLVETTAAFEQLTLAADGSYLPVLQRAKPAEAPAPASAVTISSPIASRPSPAPKASGSREFLLVAALAVVVFIVGGWWIVKTRAEAAEKARVEAAAAAVQDKARAALVEIETRWAALDKDFATADRKLTELKADARNTKDLPAPEVAELQARLAAHKAYVEWLQPYLAESPLALQLPKAEALLAAKSATAADLIGQLAATLSTAEQTMATQKRSLLSLGRPLSITSAPAGLTYRLTDAYGRASEGTTPVTVQVPWGRTEVVITAPGPDWTDSQHSLRINRDDDTAPTVSAAFTRAAVRITSEPSGLRYTVKNAAGFSRTGTTPAELTGVPSGDVQVEVVRAGWPAITQGATVPSVGLAAVVAEFVPGSVEVTSTPSGAEVWVGDKKLGLTPLTVPDLIPGEHAFRLNLKGHKTTPASGRVKSRETTQVAAELAVWEGPEEGEPFKLPGLGLQLMPIPAGSFRMGSSNGDYEGPVHTVTISRGYWLGKTEVTQGEWAAIMGTAPSYFKGAERPVEQVDWDEAMEFCRKLTERERSAGRLAEGWAYTLPTEAQWEYACRAGTTGDYAGDLDEMGWYKDNSGSQTHAVGQKRANAWGLYDMHGNVLEWCADWYGGYSKGIVSDPTGASSGSSHVHRGGSWDYTDYFCRSASRGGFGSGSRYASGFGFRLALSLVR